MMTQDVTWQAALLIGGTVGKIPPKQKQDIAGFEQLLNKNEGAAGLTAKDRPPDRRVLNDSKRNIVKTVTRNGPKKALPTQQEILAALQSIREAVSKALQTTPDELDQMLGDMGLTLYDLADMEALQALLLQKSGNQDVTAFLTDEDLAAEMMELYKTVETIKEEAGLSLSADQLMAAIDALAKEEDAARAGFAGQEANTAPQEADGMETIAQEEVSRYDRFEEDGYPAAERYLSDDRRYGQTEDAVMESTKTAGRQVKGSEDMPVKADAIRAKDREPEELNYAGKAEAAQHPEEENRGRSGTEGKSRDQAGQDAALRMDDFLNKAWQARNTAAVFPEDMPREVTFREIAEQIIGRIKVILTPDRTSMEMQLHPDHLGNVNLTVQSRNGSMTAQFVVQNETAKEAIEGQMQILKDSLSQQGIKVEAIEVMISSNTFRQDSGKENEGQPSGQRKSHGHRITLEEALLSDEVPMDKDMPVDITGVRGSSIDTTI